MSNQKQILQVTPKALREIKLALRAAAGARTTELERTYLRAVLKSLEAQEK